MHGEDVAAQIAQRFVPETPPYARGRLGAGMGVGAGGRNTPVCTGKTTSHSHWIGESEKHPRMHGEDVLDSGLTLGLEETPPYARGRQINRREVNVSLGNTPVCTGKTYPKNIFYSQNKKHPRMHGEDC